MAHASRPPPEPEFRRVVAAKSLGGTRLRLRFDDGEEGELDLAQHVPFRGVLGRLADPHFFARVRVAHGTIWWPGDIDFDPDVVHEWMTGRPNRAHGHLGAAAAATDPPPRPASATGRRAMPEICRFMGIVIRMYFNDHPKPHFHAQYARHRASLVIETLELLDGRLPPRIHGMVVEWAAQHREELMENWERLRRHEPVRPISPLE